MLGSSQVSFTWNLMQSLWLKSNICQLHHVTWRQMWLRGEGAVNGWWREGKFQKDEHQSFLKIVPIVLDGWLHICPQPGLWLNHDAFDSHSWQAVNYLQVQMNHDESAHTVALYHIQVSRWLNHSVSCVKLHDSIDSHIMRGAVR